MSCSTSSSTVAEPVSIFGAGSTTKRGPCKCIGRCVRETICRCLGRYVREGLVTGACLSYLLPVPSFSYITTTHTHSNKVQRAIIPGFCKITERTQFQVLVEKHFVATRRDGVLEDHLGRRLFYGEDDAEVEKANMYWEQRQEEWESAQQQKQGGGGQREVVEEEEEESDDEEFDKEVQANRARYKLTANRGRWEDDDDDDDDDGEEEEAVAGTQPQGNLGQEEGNSVPSMSQEQPPVVEGETAALVEQEESEATLTDALLTQENVEQVDK